MTVPSKDQGADSTREWRDALERISDPFDGPDLDGCRALAQRALDDAPVSGDQGAAREADAARVEALAEALYVTDDGRSDADFRTYPWREMDEGHVKGRYRERARRLVVASASGRGAAVGAEGDPGAAPIKTESPAYPVCLEPQEAEPDHHDERGTYWFSPLVDVAALVSGRVRLDVSEWVGSPDEADTLAARLRSAAAKARSYSPAPLSPKESTDGDE